MNDSGAETSTLRHGLTYLWPSEIANQWYCEYKVHLQRLHPEVVLGLLPLERGEANHAVLASQAEPITPAEIEQSIRAGKRLALCEWILEGAFRGVRIRGRPDFFTFEGKEGRLLLDFKFARARTPFPNHEVQAQIYALLAQDMGFSVDQLCFGIVLFPTFRPDTCLRAAHDGKDAMLEYLNVEGTLGKIHDLCEQARASLLAGRAKKRTVEDEGWKAFLYRYDRKRAEKDLAWALDYWLSEREPIPVRQMPRKCFSCPLNAAGLCEHALQEPDPGFVVKRRPDGLVFVYR
jgi:hypothetical protein